jgi:hypothetical protein
MKIVEKPPRNSARFCGGGQGLSWAVEPRKEEDILGYFKISSFLLWSNELYPAVCLMNVISAAFSPLISLCFSYIEIMGQFKYFENTFGQKCFKNILYTYQNL